MAASEISHLCYTLTKVSPILLEAALTDVLKTWFMISWCFCNFHICYDETFIWQLVTSAGITIVLTVFRAVISKFMIFWSSLRSHRSKLRLLPPSHPLSNHISSHTAWKVSKYWVFSGPYFPAFGLNTKRYSVSLCIQSECGKIRTKKNYVFGHFPGGASLWTYANPKLENVLKYVQS